MDPVARKIVGILAVIAGIILGVVGVLAVDPGWAKEIAGGVIAASVAAGVLLL